MDKITEQLNTYIELQNFFEKYVYQYVQEKIKIKDNDLDQFINNWKISEHWCVINYFSPKTYSNEEIDIPINDFIKYILKK